MIVEGGLESSKSIQQAIRKGRLEQSDMTEAASTDRIFFVQGSLNFAPNAFQLIESTSPNII